MSIQNSIKTTYPIMNKKILSVSLLGNSLEFYDLGLCGFLSLIMSPLFFPSSNPFLLMLSSMAVFAIGFVMRPIGAILFGYIGDSLGRKVSLSHTMLLMAIPTFVISILPTYQQIGLLAPIIFIICRMMQGICIGGECNNAAIYILESTESSKIGFWSGVITSSSNLGFFLASSISLLLFILPFSIQWTWRIPFFLGALVGFLGFYLRQQHVMESPIFQKPSASKLAWKSMNTIKSSLFAVLTLGFFASTLCLTMVGYIPSYLNVVAGLTKNQAMLIANLGLLLFMLLLPITGAISDKLGMKPVMRTSAVIALLSSYVIYHFLSSGSLSLIIIGEVMLASITALYMGPMHAYTLSLFPPEFRCRGISIAFSIGVGILGGLTPLISTFLIEILDSNKAPALYMGLSAIAGILSTFLNSNTIKEHKIMNVNGKIPGIRKSVLAS